MNSRLALALAALTAVTCAPAPRPMNVVLIVVDTLRGDRLGANGFPRGTTPHLDALARRGATFSRAYAAASWTLPSVGSILTGLYPTTLAATRFRSRIPDAVETLAERLHAEGYATAAVVSHVLVSARLGFGQGFDVFDEEEIGGARYVSSPGITERGERLLREFARGQDPFFLFLHYFDPHFAFVRHPQFGYSSPSSGRITGGERHLELAELDPPPTVAEIDHLLDRYDEEVRLTDAAIGGVLRALETLDLAEQTLVVVTADHGEEFWDHGRFGHGRSQSLHEEVVRVPLVLGSAPTAPVLVNEVVSLVSITPTIVAQLGLPSDERFQATALPGIGTSESAGVEPALCEFVFTGRDHVRGSDRDVRRALVGPRYKLITGGTAGRMATYDLVSDPAEQNPLRGSVPDPAAALAPHLAARVEELENAAYPAENADLRDPERERLRALGYVGD